MDNKVIKESFYRRLKRVGLIPKLWLILSEEGYSKEKFFKDFTAGIIVGIIALPLSIALAVASGVTPEKGLFTAIVAGFLISLLGGSRVQIGGPTGAFVVIVYGIVEKYGMDGLITATIMAGIFLMIMGFMQLGSIIKFIPYPITTGFTNGIAVAIAATQIKDFLGLSIDKVPSEFVDKAVVIAKNINTINLNSLILAVMSIVIMLLWPKFNKKIPGSLIAVLVTTAAVILFKMDVETIGSKFSDISSTLPMPHFPNVDYATIKTLITPALTIAVLAGIESLLSAVVADGMTGCHHKSNMELVAQGAGNIGSALFGGIPATGAIARTAANIKNGGKTPIAGIVHALTVLLIMVIFMPYAKLIPMATLAAVLMIVAYNMGEWEEFREIFKAPKSDALVFILTFLLTVFFDLVTAIEIGMILAAFLFMKRMSDVTNIKSIEESEDEDTLELEGAIFRYNKSILKKVLIYEINGAFFFGAADKFLEVSNHMHENYKVLILRMGKVPVMDATGFHALEIIYNICKNRKVKIIFSNMQEQPYKILEKYKFTDKIGKESFCETIDEAIEVAAEYIDK